jgi:hypothetical protein
MMGLFVPFFPVSVSPSLSMKAQEVLEKHKEEITDTMEFREVQSHDGYDEEGSKSDLWDLYLIDWIDNGIDNGIDKIENEKRVVNMKHFHREQWYWGKESEPYVLVEEVTMETQKVVLKYPELNFGH